MAAGGPAQGVIDALRLALKLPSCRRKFPRDIGKERPCLNYHMGQCDGYCRREMDQSRYPVAIAQAVRLLEGKLDEVVEELSDEMNLAAEDLRFERAAQLRDQIKAIQLLAKRQKAVAGSLADTDVVGWNRGEAKSCFVVLHYVDGELAAKDWQLLADPMEEDERDTVSALTAQFYAGRTSLPRQILLPLRHRGPGGLGADAYRVGGPEGGAAYPPAGGEGGAGQTGQRERGRRGPPATTAEERRSKLMEALGRLLGLPGTPHRMEAFDISNTGSSDIVASMTRPCGWKAPETGLPPFQAQGHAPRGRLRLHEAGR